MDPRLVVFVRSMAIFEDPYSDDAAVLAAIAGVESGLVGPEAEATKTAFLFWKGGYLAAREAMTRNDVKRIMIQYMCTDHEHSASPYNVAQGLMKATAHRLWWRLYAIMSAGHLAFEPAFRDAITPPLQRALEYNKELFEEIAAEKGETAKEMLARACGDKA